MKRLITKKQSKTSKQSIRRIYLDDKHMNETGFKIGGIFSYEVDLNRHQVRIVPNNSLTGKGKVSKKKRGDQLIPIIDVNNKLIEQTFNGMNCCQITIFEDEVLIEGITPETSSETTPSQHQTRGSFTSMVQNVISFAQKKKERQVAIRLKQEALNEILAKKSTKVAAGQLNLFDSFTLSEDTFTQQVVTNDEFKQQLPLLNKTLKVLSLFSGIGAFEEALKNLGVDYELVNYCEHKEKIAKAYSIIHQIPESKNLGDIEKVDETQLADFDLMTVGFPCQDVSSLGNQQGFFNKDGSLTRSGLFYEAMRIARAKKPRLIVLENVRGLLFKTMKPFFDEVLTLLKELGYNVRYKLMNSKDYNVPQSRNRVFFVAIRSDIDNHQFQFPEPEPLTVKAPDWYDSMVDIPDSVYVGPKQYKYFNEMRLKKKYSSLNADTLICFTTKMGNISCPQNFIRDERGVRILTASEMFRFQGFRSEYGNQLLEAGYKLPHIGYMLGNSITVNVVQKVLANLFQSLYGLHSISSPNTL